MAEKSLKRASGGYDASDKDITQGKRMAMGAKLDGQHLKKGGKVAKKKLGGLSGKMMQDTPRMPKTIQAGVGGTRAPMMKKGGEVKCAKCGGGHMTAKCTGGAMKRGGKAKKEK